MVTVVIVAVIDEFTYSVISTRSVFVGPDVNILVFYHFPKSFYLRRDRGGPGWLSFSEEHSERLLIILLVWLLPNPLFSNVDL